MYTAHSLDNSEAASLLRTAIPVATALADPGLRRDRDLVERFFAYVTTDLLQRCDHRSVQAPETDIRNWVKAWNNDPRPFIWTKSAEQILDSLARLLQRTTGAGH